MLRARPVWQKDMLYKSRKNKQDLQAGGKDGISIWKDARLLGAGQCELPVTKNTGTRRRCDWTTSCLETEECQEVQGMLQYN